MGSDLREKLSEPLRAKFDMLASGMIGMVLVRAGEPQEIETVEEAGRIVEALLERRKGEPSGVVLKDVKQYLGV